MIGYLPDALVDAIPVSDTRMGSNYSFFEHDAIESQAPMWTDDRSSESSTDDKPDQGMEDSDLIDSSSGEDTFVYLEDTYDRASDADDTQDYDDQTDCDDDSPLIPPCSLPVPSHQVVLNVLEYYLSDDHPRTLEDTPTPVQVASVLNNYLQVSINRLYQDVLVYQKHKDRLLRIDHSSSEE